MPLRVRIFPFLLSLLFFSSRSMSYYLQNWPCSGWDRLQDKTDWPLAKIKTEANKKQAFWAPPCQGAFSSVCELSNQQSHCLGVHSLYPYRGRAISLNQLSGVLVLGFLSYGTHFSEQPGRCSVGSFRRRGKASPQSWADKEASFIGSRTARLATLLIGVKISVQRCATGDMRSKWSSHSNEMH